MVIIAKKYVFSETARAGALAGSLPYDTVTKDTVTFGRNKDCINKNNSVLIKFIPINQSTY